ncbi:MAG: NADH:flavin oxidoreductase, partial [Sandaracinobacteroides sp.]
MPDPAQPLAFARGPALKNRLVLAPLTNQQSNPDGTLSDAEFRWLTMRAQGGFALTMTCASHVRKDGQAFEGQLGICSDAHIPGLARLAAAIRAGGSLSAVQLHHGGARSDPAITGEPRRAAFDDPETGATALATGEVETLRDDFVRAAVRAQQAGFDGVELHGAHGYMLCSFLASASNARADRYGGSLDNRMRILFEIIDGIRSVTRADFQLGIRISPERVGIPLPEAREIVQRLLECRQLDWVDLSLWDVFKPPEGDGHAGTDLIDHFIDLPRHGCRLGVAGKIMGAQAVRNCLDRGADFVLVGRGAVLHHDFAALVL